MRRLLGAALVLGLVGLLLTRAEPLGPTVALERPVEAVGRATAIRVTARDRGSGLAWIEIRVVPAGGEPAVLARESHPRRSWRGSGIHETTMSATLDAAAARLPEGRATLEVWAADHSWIALVRRGPHLALPVTVDLTPPRLEVTNEERVMRVGGSESVVYRVSSDAVLSGVRVGEEFFPATPGLFADPALHAALFAIPENAPGARPSALARDAAGNESTVPVPVRVEPRRFAERTLPVTDDFLARKVPALLRENGLADSGDLLAGYLLVNGGLRGTTERRVREMCAESAPRPLWGGALLRMPGSAPLSGFGDRRTYVHGTTTIDRQTHLGVDLASLRGATVPAAAAGRVVVAGALGIYGNTVIVDHGLGLFTLYGHLSEMAVAGGTEVARGDPLGRTGETGLAGGDHLHFSVMIHGVHVDPVEWWDGHWIQDHVERRLAAFPRAGAGS